MGLAKAAAGADWVRRLVRSLGPGAGAGAGAGAKLVVFAHHRAVLDRLQAALEGGGGGGGPVGLVRLDGETPMAARVERLRRFRRRPDVPVALVSVTAGGQASPADPPSLSRPVPSLARRTRPLSAGRCLV